MSVIGPKAERLRLGATKTPGTHRTRKCETRGLVRCRNLQIGIL